MSYRDYPQFRQALLAGTTTCVQAVAQFLAQIEARKALNAYVQVHADAALAAAREEDTRIQAGQARPLSGLVLAVKDNIALEASPLTASSHILAGYRSPYTATALQRLTDAGAIVIGITGCDEFAMGSSNETSVYGPVQNPYGTGRAPGGSSGGSAAAVAAGLCHAALGSDTGGSIRQPAAFCGIVGLKPTYGRVSRYGLIAFGSSFDQIGPMTHSVETAALMLEVMAGTDPQDSTCAHMPVPAYTEGLKSPHAPARIGVLQPTIENPGLSAEMRTAFEQKVAQLRNLGHEVVPVDFPLLDYLVPTYYVLATAEASSNLSRYDGIRYGYRAQDAQNLEEVYVRSRTQGFGPEVKRRIMLGTFVLSSGYYDAYYTKAQQVRGKIARLTAALLQQVDFLISPTTPTSAFELGSHRKQDPISMYLADIFTVHANLSGQPAISIPMGEDAQGLPMGFQLMSGYYQEAALLQLAHQLS
ncbi:MAG: Asp-tRNA(Asn)/Glu-tRNA(Gln) amidotransferase subunit GatA [Bacteroidetes bacterium]|nr:Asp-tRNA(Asn)/Glu-tRNA(Gln) amidotransferase subunit GatA [Bacteroidota bacterium]